MSKEKDHNQLLLGTRLTILMVRFEYNFLTSLSDYQSQLKKLFNYEYNQDEIEKALHTLEEAHIATELDEARSRGLIEYPEDY
jgi:hypothetical protein